jgi:hypothetical protein
MSGQSDNNTEFSFDNVIRPIWRDWCFMSIVVAITTIIATGIGGFNWFIGIFLVAVNFVFICLWGYELCYMAVHDAYARGRLGAIEEHRKQMTERMPQSSLAVSPELEDNDDEYARPYKRESTRSFGSGLIANGNRPADSRGSQAPAEATLAQGSAGQ